MYFTNIMTKILKTLFLSFCLPMLVLANNTDDDLTPVDYVQTLMGTQSEFSLSAGNTYPAIALPWGMNFWSPQTGVMGDGWMYSYNAHRIRGFKQTHQPSPWMNDYGQFAIMPVIGDVVDQEARASWFSHMGEKATPYYYSVYLADHDILTEIAPTERAAIMTFTFPENENSGVVVDAFDRGSSLEILDDYTLRGYTTRNSEGVPSNFKNYFIVRFDKPFKSFKLYNDSVLVEGKELTGNHALTRVQFDTKRGDKVNLRVASSFISYEQAEQNLKELGNRNLQEVANDAKNIWNKELGKIEVSGGTESQMKTFYSCLYRSLLFPRKFYEITEAGKIVHYSPHDGSIRDGYMYTDTGFWDTFRSLFPLLNLVYPSVNKEIQEGLANTYSESGFLPEWQSPGHRGIMVGNNSASVVADAILKGITSPKIVDQLYEAMQFGTKNVHPTVSSTGRLGHEYYNTLGYVPYDVDIHENAARTLEYAYNDWCILQIAKKLNRPQEEIAELEKRSQNYRNLYDAESKLMRGKNKDGSFQTPFSPYKWGGAFTEGNSWHYTWSVFHDPQGLINLMGGEEDFVQMLDSVFIVPPIYDDSYYGVRIHEITEMQVVNMGNYAHGNQPAQHMIYLYNYAKQPWKAQYWLREVMNRLYKPTPDGYSGDEDNGQTSAWYVFSALGFYPVAPGTDEYIVGAPLFKNATIHLENGKSIKIEAPKNGKNNRYINSMRMNGKNYTKNYLRYSELNKGAKIQFDMANEPNKKRGTKEEDKPYSMSR